MREINRDLGECERVKWEKDGEEEDNRNGEME